MNITPINTAKVNVNTNHQKTNINKPEQTFGINNVRWLNEEAYKRFIRIFPTKKEYNECLSRLSTMQPASGKDIPLLISPEPSNHGLRLAPDDKNDLNSTIVYLAQNKDNVFAIANARTLKERFWAGINELLTLVTGSREYSIQDQSNMIKGFPLLQPKTDLKPISKTQQTHQKSNAQANIYPAKPITKFQPGLPLPTLPSFRSTKK